MSKTISVIVLNYLSKHHDDVLMIGVYSSVDEQANAVGRMSLKPGFAENTSRFRASVYEVDRVYSEEPPYMEVAALGSRRFSESLPSGASVFCLWYIEDAVQMAGGKLVGIFSTVDVATAARIALTADNGFLAEPEGWPLDTYVVNEDHWTSGFESVDGQSTA
jgi:hypothetical protein